MIEPAKELAPSWFRGRTIEERAAEHRQQPRHVSADADYDAKLAAGKRRRQEHGRGGDAANDTQAEQPDVGNPFGYASCGICQGDSPLKNVG